MRHGNKINHLGRKTAHRDALLKNMAASLVQHKRINTTLAKARELRKFLEPLLTKAKANTTHSRRVIFSYIQSKDAIKEIFSVIGPKILNRPGGYLRIIKTGWRSGDAAEMAMIEFVDFNEIYTTGTKPDAAKESGRKRKTRRSAKKSKGTGSESEVGSTENTADTNE
jgi:large subunit ribosomal protein L17